MDLSLTRCW